MLERIADFAREVAEPDPGLPEANLPALAAGLAALALLVPVLEHVAWLLGR